MRRFAIDVPVETMLDVVWDVEHYPKFVKGVRKVTVLRDGETEREAEFRAGIKGMEFRYVLELTRTPDAVRWRRLRGSFRDAAGAVIHEGGQDFRYENALDPGFAAPGFAVRFVLERSLPRLIREFCARAKQQANERPA